MANTYQKIANNTCADLQGLTYATITDSVRQLALQIVISTIVPLITYTATIQIISQYLATLICLQSYGIDITVLKQYDVDLSVEQEVRA